MANDEVVIVDTMGDMVLTITIKFESKNASNLNGMPKQKTQ